MVGKPGKHQRSKQRCQDLGWKVHDRAKSFVLRSHTMHELRNQQLCLIRIFFIAISSLNLRNLTNISRLKTQGWNFEKSITLCVENVKTVQLYILS